MKKILHFLAAVMFFGQMLVAQEKSFWRKLDSNEVSRYSRARQNINAEGEHYFSLDANSFKQTLGAAKDKFSNQPGILVEMPNLNGEIETFEVWENSNFDSELQTRFPEIRAYVGRGVSDRNATINFSFSPQGVQTMVFRTDTGLEFIEAYDKAANTYVLFNSTNRNKGKLPLNCSTVDRAMMSDLESKLNLETLSNNRKYNTLRLALSCTGEYSNFFGATSTANVALVLAAFNATMTRVNGIFEKDIATHLNIVSETTNVIYYDGASDPYDDADIGTGNSASNNYYSTWNAQLMNALHDTLTDAAFDIGHLFGASGGGGNAGCVGCICGNSTAVDADGSPISYKGSAFTSPYDNIPQGDNYDIDFVVHELGHQLGATHSFTFSYEGTTSQVEPGSGSTIMGYAGVTVSYDVQAHSDAFFAYKNILQMQSNITAKACPVKVNMTDVVPVVNAGPDYIIPKGTPFMLTATASDADADDVLTYVWEQNDSGTATTVDAASRVSATKAVGPNFRSFAPTTSLRRYFPQMSKILLAQLATASNWEALYSGAANRDFNFAFLARDNHAGGGQTAVDGAKVTVDVTKGPFAVTSQATTAISYAGGSTQTVTWNVLSSDGLAGGSTVDILLSTNVSGNNTTFTTVLASGVPNNGSATVVIPNLPTASTTCRIMVKASANIFFAINSRNFTIMASLGTEDFGLSNFVLFPNPNNGNFNIQFTSNSSNSNGVKVLVHDIRGRLILENNFENSATFNQNIQLNNAQAGVYLLTVTDGEMKQTKKIVVE